MNTNFTPSPQEELEARITALLLGELSPDEAAALETQIASKAELQRVRREIEETIPFLKEALQPAADLKLSPERWAQMTQSFKIIQTEELGVGKKSKSTWRTVAALAAMVAVLFVGVAALIPNFVKARSSRVAFKGRIIDQLGDAEEPAENKSVLLARPANSQVSEDRKAGKNSELGIALPSVVEPNAGDAPVEPQAATRGFGERTAGLIIAANGKAEAFGGIAGGGGNLGAFSGEGVVELQKQVVNLPAPAPARAPVAAIDNLGATRPRPLATSVPDEQALSGSAAAFDKNSALNFQPAPAEPSLGLDSRKGEAVAQQASKSKSAEVYYYKADPEAMRRKLPELKAPMAEPAKKDALAGSQDRYRMYRQPSPLLRPGMPPANPVPAPNAGQGVVNGQNLNGPMVLADSDATSLGTEVRLQTTTSAASKPAAITRGLGREKVDQKAVDRFDRGAELKESEAVKDVASNELPTTGGVHSVNAVGYVNVQGLPELKVESHRVDSADAAIVIAKQAAPVPQPEMQTAENAFSTFSLNVSDVSFKLAGASLEKGLMPDAGAIRSEEFLNSFDYRDAEAMAAPVAFAWERARYPFAQDREVLRLSIKTAASGRQAGRPLNLVLLLDNSGSMERADRVQILRECLRTLTAQLTAADRVSVVTFARTARLAVDGLTGAEIGQLPQRVGALAPEGGTNLEEAMRLAYETAQKHFLAGGVNRVVMLTDGAANLGDVRPEALKQTVETQRRKGIALDCFGIGWDGLNDDLLETLSRNGDGRYGFVNTPEAAGTEFAGQLAGALKVAASDVKVQVEFNPKRVTAYRQIGYAKHQLTKEQFRDNTVDAAELGAAEAGNAVYVAQVNPRGEGPLGTVRARFKIPGTNDYREHEWPLTFDGPARAADQASYALRLASSAAAFSEFLAGNPYAGEVTTDHLLQLMSGVPEFFAPDPRPKKLETMIREAKSIAGR